MRKKVVLNNFLKVRKITPPWINKKNAIDINHNIKLFQPKVKSKYE